jgi:toxin ParE1/3/4
MADYRLAPAAERDLEQVWRLTAIEWGVDQANRYLDTLTEAFARLAEWPESASACDHIRPGYRRRHIARHVVYFRTTTYGIDVMRILHDRMDAGRHL